VVEIEEWRHSGYTDLGTRNGSGVDRPLGWRWGAACGIGTIGDQIRSTAPAMISLPQSTDAQSAARRNATLTA
jgi:hypothetical protein